MKKYLDLALTCMLLLVMGGSMVLMIYYEQWAHDYLRATYHGVWVILCVLWLNDRERDSSR